MVGTTQSLPVVLVIMESILLVYEGQTMLETPMLRGGGNRSTQPTKMFGRGTELPREGDALCVTFNKFKSVLRAASRKFVLSQWVTSICQPIAQVQQALTGVRGHLSQIVSSCGQVVRGIPQVALQLLVLKQKIFQTTRTIYMVGLTKVHMLEMAYIQFKTLVGEVLDTTTEWLKDMSLIKHLVFQGVRLTFLTPTAPVIAGIAPLSLAVM